MTVSPASIPPTRGMKMTPVLWLQLAILSLLWGGSFLFGKIVVAEIPAFTAAFVRVAIAATTLWVVIWLTGRRFPVNRNFLGILLIIGLFNNAIPFSLILLGQKEIGAGLASIINAMAPVWTLLIAHLLTGEDRISPRRIVGIAFAIGGVAVLVGPAALDGLTAPLLAQIAVLMATVSYAVAAVFAMRNVTADPLTISTGQLTASSLILAPVALATDAPWTIETPGMAAVSSLVLMAVFCTALAYILYFRILAGAGATHVSLVTMLVPVSATLLGAAILGERLAAGQLAGMVVILLGLLIIDGKLIPRFRR